MRHPVRMRPLYGRLLPMLKGISIGTPGRTRMGVAVRPRLTSLANVPTVDAVMSLHYRCILIDHDDTAVDSTAAIHYPAHLEALRVLRPGRTPPSRNQWMVHNFHGIMEYLVGELGLTREEQEREFVIWRGFATSHIPPFFPGFLPLLADYHSAGGRVAVISHSEADVIASHYRAACDSAARDAPAPGSGFQPDLIFGWEHDAEKRKPSPWPVLEALRAFDCPPSAALIVDDLKPGVLMSQAAGVDIAAAGWSHRIPEIERYMRANAVAYCSTIEELRSFLLGG